MEEDIIEWIRQRKNKSPPHLYPYINGLYPLRDKLVELALSDAYGHFTRISFGLMPDSPDFIRHFTSNGFHGNTITLNSPEPPANTNLSRKENKAIALASIGEREGINPFWLMEFDYRKGVAIPKLEYWQENLSGPNTFAGDLVYGYSSNPHKLLKNRFSLIRFLNVGGKRNIDEVIQCSSGFENEGYRLSFISANFFIDPKSDGYLGAEITGGSELFVSTWGKIPELSTDIQVQQPGDLTRASSKNTQTLLIPPPSHNYATIFK